MPFQDRVLRCRDCNQEFVFPAGDQEAFAAKGYSNDPSRCLDCRASRKARIAERQATTADSPYAGYNLNGTFAANGRREYFRATCSTCGGEALLPFVPRGDKPVYCSSCFDQVRSRR